MYTYKLKHTCTHIYVFNENFSNKLDNPFCRVPVVTVVHDDTESSV